jgi:hypothetical protein
MAVTPAGGGLVYDYHLVFVNGKPEFKQWSDVVPTFSYNKATPYFQVCAAGLPACRLHSCAQKV